MSTLMVKGVAILQVRRAMFPSFLSKRRAIGVCVLVFKVRKRSTKKGQPAVQSSKISLENT